MTTEPTTATTRNASLDATRGVLMMLGIVLHASNIYSEGGDWLVRDTESSPVFNAIRNSIHVFRIPVFFWISGYFCALIFRQSGARGLLSRRVPRLALPLITTWLTLNWFQSYLITVTGGREVSGALNTSIPLYHLWFLVDLVIYIALAAVLLPWFRAFASLGKRLEQIPPALLLPALAALSLALSLAARATGFAYESPLGLTSLFRLATGATYFAAGIFMYHHTNARQSLLSSPAKTIVFALPLAMFAHEYIHGHGLIVGEIALYVEYLMTWICLSVILGLAHQLVRTASSITQFFSDSAYSIFLFHHLLVFAIGYAMLGYAMGAWIKFFLVCTGSLALSCLLHYAVIQHSRVACLPFNGR
jgi:glucan biosynthesis protein C